MRGQQTSPRSKLTVEQTAAAIKEAGARKHASAMRGDVHAVARLKKRDDRSDKAAASIKRKLDRKNGNRLRALRAAHGEVVPASEYAAAPPKLANVDSWRKAIDCLRDSRSKRMFILADIWHGDDAAALVVADASDEACQRRLHDAIDCVGATDDMLILSTSAPIKMGASRGSFVTVRKLIMRDGSCVFRLALADAPSAGLSAKALGIDVEMHGQLAAQAARLTGVTVTLR